MEYILNERDLFQQKLAVESQSCVTKESQKYGKKKELQSDKNMVLVVSPLLAIMSEQ